ncbi:CheR family methyltransferase [Maridesulfovibrio zosterae]|uniref:CheR family methyltransferase n=1 Tax=Maridesulfovibrio zosterae TaxID=82171 RepID=UPI001FE12215|nr:protein-glutamate O-methyltransferase CheR [Maridesulfovibrio zosterae]
MNDLTDEKIQQLASMVRDKYGLDFQSDRWRDLRHAVKDFYSDNKKFNSSVQCLDYIISPQAMQKDLELFINNLTIGETYFFRDPRTLDVVEQDILRNKCGKGSGINGAVRIWSMACATGEEPYTLAMICNRSKVCCEIFGTDIDSRALIKAEEGHYRKWSFRTEATAYRDIYFHESGTNSYFIDQSIKDMVTLTRFNLIGDKIPASFTGMDLIFCRNVLMYFSSEGVNLVLDKIWNSMSPGGILVVTASESALITNHGKFEPVSFGPVLLFRKNVNFAPEKLQFSDLYDDSISPDSFDLPQGFGLSGSDFSDYQSGDFCDDYTSPEAGPDLLVQDDTDIFSTDILDSSETMQPSSESAVDSCGVDFIAEAEKLRRIGDKSGALTLLRRSLDTGLSRDKKVAVLYALAEINADSGMLDDAAYWCKQAIEADKVSAEPHFMLGQIKMQQGDLDGAVAEVRNAIFLNSGFIMAHVVLGNIYMSCSDKLSAMRHFRIALQELDRLEHDEIIPYSDGTTAGRLKEMVKLVNNNIG